MNASPVPGRLRRLDVRRQPGLLRLRGLPPAAEGHELLGDRRVDGHRRLQVAARGAHAHCDLAPQPSSAMST